MNITTPYQTLPSSDPDPEAGLEHNVLYHNVEETNFGWGIIPNLDIFFNCIYKYHQAKGLKNIIIAQVVQIVITSLCIIFGLGLIALMFEIGSMEKRDDTAVTWIMFEILPSYLIKTSVLFVLILPCSFVFVCMCVCLVKKIWKYSEIRRFYTNILKISPEELENVTWHEVQLKLLAAQKHTQMFINKKELTELDIYNRILRFDNYYVAMVNKDLIPMKYNVPLKGEWSYFPKLLHNNLNQIFFGNKYSVFPESWKLDERYKKYSNRKMMARKLNRMFLIIGLINLILIVPIFFVYIFFFCFNYLELIKRDPSILSTRVWTPYSKFHLRHFNELDHELKMRLCRAYKPSLKYMSSNVNKSVEIISGLVAYIFGALSAITFIIMFFGEKNIDMTHNIMCGLAFSCVTIVASKLRQDEFMAIYPEQLLKLILSHIHYIPDEWKKKAHTKKVMNEFSQLFQFRVEYMLGEILSPLFTPFILFSMRKRSLDIVDFFRNYTVEVEAVGDVCSFAMMDLKKHGDSKWCVGVPTTANQVDTTKYGKSELSLIHFTMTNPNWPPSGPSQKFLNTVKARASEYTQTDVEKSFYETLSLDTTYASLMQPCSQTHPYNPGCLDAPHNVSKTCQEGPDYPTSSGVLASISNGFQSKELDPCYTAKNMGISALFLHELHDSMNESCIMPRFNEFMSSEDGDESNKRDFTQALSEPGPFNDRGRGERSRQEEESLNLILGHELPPLASMEYVNIEDISMPFSYPIRP